jgi:ATP-binding cassette, subfamily B, bacterial MsbA
VSDTNPRDQQPAWPLVTRLWRTYLHKHIGWMAVAFILMTIEGASTGLFSYMLKPVFDNIFVAGQLDTLWWVGGAILLIFTVRAVVGVLNRMIVMRISQRCASDMQVDLVGHVLHLDSVFFQSNSPGHLMERIQGDSAAVQAVWRTLVEGLGRDIITLIALMSVTLSIDVGWTLTALIGVPLLVVPIMVIQRYIRRRTSRLREDSALRSTRLNEILHGVDAIKLNEMESYQKGLYKTLIDKIIDGAIRSEMARATLPGFVDIVTGIGFFGVMILAGTEIVGGDKTVGDFMSFLTAMILTFQPVKRLGAMAGTIQTAAASLERVFDLLDTPPTIDDPAQPVARPTGPYDVHLKNVSFAYGDLPVLRDVSFTAAAGKTTALVGASGAGKTTIFKALTRLVDPDQGQITIGGVDGRQMGLADLRGLFSTVTQDALLFDETLHENIVLGEDSVAPDRLANVLDAARVSPFLDQLPMGLDSRVGPRGSALSGGQRQRVAIAHALLRDTPVLLLDEATSALDTESEKLVQQALDRLAQGRTTLTIAHRLSTVRNADKIIVLDGGRVVEQGTHDTLLEAGGRYADLYNMQFRSRDAESD